MHTTGTNTLIEGPTGTGKTFSLGTAADWAQEHNFLMHVLFLEPSAETLLGYWRDRGKEPPPCLSIQQLSIPAIPLADLVVGAREVGRRTYQQVTSMVDQNRAENNPYVRILETLTNFKDDRTGKTFGDAGRWDETHIFAIDGLSEFANAAMKMVIGNRPAASQSDYGVAQNNIMNFIRWFVGCPFHGIMIAHVDRQIDEIAGGTKIMTKALGKAISQDIPPLFSDVILSVRDGTNFWWDTLDPKVDLKTRNLPISAKISPDFGQIFSKWANRILPQE